MKDSRILKVTFTGERGGGFDRMNIVDYTMLIRGREQPLKLATSGNYPTRLAIGGVQVWGIKEGYAWDEVPEAVVDLPRSWHFYNMQNTREYGRIYSPLLAHIVFRLHWFTAADLTVGEVLYDVEADRNPYIEYEWPRGPDRYLKFPGNIVDHHI